VFLGVGENFFEVREGGLSSVFYVCCYALVERGGEGYRTRCVGEV